MLPPNGLTDVMKISVCPYVVPSLRPRALALYMGEVSEENSLSSHPLAAQHSFKQPFVGLPPFWALYLLKKKSASI